MESSGLRQIAQLLMIYKGIVIFKHVVQELINIRLWLSLVLNLSLTKDLSSETERWKIRVVCCAGLAT